jgi:hypothetical protein
MKRTINPPRKIKKIINENHPDLVIIQDNKQIINA